MLILFVSWARKHIHADGKSSPFKIKVESPAVRSRQPVTPSLVSRPWSGSPSVIRPEACAPWEKTATAEWQPTTGFTAVVSGGRQVGRMDDLSEGFYTALLCSDTYCYSTPPHPFPFIYTAVRPRVSGGTAANRQTALLNIM